MGAVREVFAPNPSWQSTLGDDRPRPTGGCSAASSGAKLLGDDRSARNAATGGGGEVLAPKPSWQSTLGDDRPRKTGGCSAASPGAKLLGDDRSTRRSARSNGAATEAGREVFAPKPSWLSTLGDERPRKTGGCSAVSSGAKLLGDDRSARNSARSNGAATEAGRNVLTPNPSWQSTLGDDRPRKTGGCSAASPGKSWKDVLGDDRKAQRSVVPSVMNPHPSTAFMAEPSVAPTLTAATPSKPCAAAEVGSQRCFEPPRRELASPKECKRGCDLTLYPDLRFGGLATASGAIACSEVSSLFGVPEVSAPEGEMPQDLEVVCFALREEHSRPEVVSGSLVSAQDVVVFAGTISRVDYSKFRAWINCAATRHRFAKDVYLYLGTAELMSLRVGDVVAFCVHLSSEGKPQASVGSVFHLQSHVFSVNRQVDATCMKIGRTLDATY